jgi:hypothetical protein
MPRFRFKLKWMMVAVAIVAMLMAPVFILWRRSSALAQQGQYHARRASEYASVYMSDYHRGLAEKYERAARYPWLPIAPDPPEPK